MFFCVGHPKRLDELDHETPNASSLRRYLNIAVIDDEPFRDSRSAIETHGYSLHEIGDITSIDLVQSYHVVVCDVKGVGKHFGSSKEGAYLLSEIRRRFPDKYLILHSSYSLGASFHQAQRVADKWLRKGTDAEAWVSVLDEAAIVMLSAKQRWMRMRRSLIESASVDLLTVLKLEQRYIHAVLAKSASKMNGLSTLESDNVVQGIVTEFAKAVAVDLAKNAFVAALSS